VKITFETTPDQAEVYEGDELLGTTPFTINRKAEESVTLSFQLKGYQTVTRKVRFSSPGRIVVQLEKAEVAPAKDTPASPRKPQGRPGQPKESDLKNAFEQEEDLKPLPF
jgi:hypothetical protein